MSVSNIMFISKDQISTHSIEQLHSRGYNWQDWWCSAGLRSLYISHDGLIYRGTCGVGGVIGSVYNHGSPRAAELSQWIKCTSNTCTCAPDMRSPKVRDTLDTDIVGMAHQSLPIRYWSPETHETVDLVKEPTITYSKDHEEFKVVVWELGRRCNYNCWYCGPSAHNNYENQKALQTMIDGYEQLARIWLCNQPTKFVFAGGESTFNPDFMQFAQYITSRGLGHVLHVTTNGSHTNQYYTELAKISSISFSAHLTYLETPNIYNKFVKNIELATINRGLNYIEVRIMLEPGKLAFAQQLYQDLKAVTNNVTVDLLHDQDLNIMEYSPEEQTWAASIH